MSLIDTLIKKVEELTKAVNSIRSSSKKIHELPDLSGEDVYVAASNGNETGKVLLQTQNLIPHQQFLIHGKILSFCHLLA